MYGLALVVLFDGQYRAFQISVHRHNSRIQIVSKNSNNKKLIILNENNFRIIQMILDIWLWNLDLVTFWQTVWKLTLNNISLELIFKKKYTDIYKYTWPQNSTTPVILSAFFCHYVSRSKMLFNVDRTTTKWYVKSNSSVYLKVMWTLIFQGKKWIIFLSFL